MSSKVSAAIALMLLCGCPGLAFAAEDCVNGYYRTKPANCADDTLALLRQAEPRGKAEPDTIIGFLGELFRSSPQDRDRLLKQETSEYVKSVEVISLYRAGLVEQAEKFIAANNLSALSDRLRSTEIPSLDAVRPSSMPRDNDLLIGAYMASGNTVFIQRILDNYSSADDAMVGDAFRIGFLISKFGPGLTAIGQDNVTVRAACEKYQCRADQRKFSRIMALATASWSLQSLARQDAGIAKTFSNFLDRNDRIKILFAAEQNAFGNYLTALAGVAAFKSGGALSERAYAAMNKSASIYESLGPANDAFAPIADFVKKSKQ